MKDKVNCRIGGCLKLFSQLLTNAPYSWRCFLEICQSWRGNSLGKEFPLIKKTLQRIKKFMFNVERKLQILALLPGKKWIALERIILPGNRLLMIVYLETDAHYQESFNSRLAKKWRDIDDCLSVNGRDCISGNRSSSKGNRWLVYLEAIVCIPWNRWSSRETDDWSTWKQLIVYLEQMIVNRVIYDLETDGSLQRKRGLVYPKDNSPLRKRWFICLTNCNRWSSRETDD